MPNNQRYLARPRINRLLERAVQWPIVTVVAGAGYGKTQGVYEFLHTFKSRTVWLQLSERDNLASRFWETFIQAVTFLDAAIADRLRETGFPETEGHFDRYLSIPRQRVEPERKYVFVFDDFHLLWEKTVLRFIEHSISTPFSNISSILISRTTPDLDLEGFRERDLLAQIDEQDLRFNLGEIMAYYQMEHISLSPDAADELYQKTEGWAFAIHLAGVALKTGGMGYAWSSVQFNSFNLLEHTLFSGLSPELQRYLIKLSLIEHWPREILQALASRPELVEDLEGIGSFIRFDVYQQRYRIHHLFLEYLREKQEILSEEEKREVYGIAADWCLKNNLKLDAVSYYERTGNYQAIFDIAFSFPQVIPNDVAAFFMEILERAPAALYETTDAHIVSIKLLINLGRFEEAATRLERIRAQFEPLPPSEFREHILCGYYLLRGFWGLLTCIYTKQYTFARYFKTALTCYGGGLQQYVLKGSIQIASLGSHSCRVSGPEQGEMERYLAEITEAVPAIAQALGGCTYGMDDLARAELAYFKADLVHAEQYALEAIRKARESHQYEIENRGLFYLIRIGLAQGNHSWIQGRLQELQAQLTETVFINRQVLYEMVTGWFYVQIRQPGYVASWLKSDFEESDLNTLMHGLDVLVKLKYQVLEKRYAPALAFLESQKQGSGIWLFLFGKIACTICEAVCLYHSGETAAALRALEAAYGLAASNGLDMPFIELGKEMRALTTAALKDKTCTIPVAWLEKIRGSSATYAQKLHRLIKIYEAPLSEQEASQLSLSSREREILISLSQGLTREEMAQAAGLSINTVKSVIKSIYNKLGALNQADAIRIATSRGLLAGPGHGA
jgi:LuxR family maltose regulon positive regulatory protein